MAPPAELYAEQQHLVQGWTHAGLPMPSGGVVGTAAWEQDSCDRPRVLTHTWVERWCECGPGSTQCVLLDVNHFQGKQEVKLTSILEGLAT